MDTNQNLSDFFSDNKQGSGSNDLSGFLDSPGVATKPATQGRSSSTLDPDLVDTIANNEGLSPTQKRVMSALLSQESGFGANPKTSTDGAHGAGQIMPGTFRMYAKPGEDINDTTHNLAVMSRIVKDLGTRFGDDPARIATGYFSGVGNVNAASGGNAWKNDHADGNKKRVSGYVADVLGRLVGVQDAQAAQPVVGAKQAAPKWADITAKPEFAALSPEKQAQAKAVYFDHYIAPMAGAKAGEYRAQFMDSKTGMTEPPGMVDKAIGAVKGIGSSISNAVGAMDSQLVGDLTPTGSVLEGAQAPTGLSTDSKVPVERSVREAENKKWDMATPDQRKALSDQPGWKGMLARERAGQFARADANGLPSIQPLDTRAEAGNVFGMGSVQETPSRNGPADIAKGLAMGLKDDFGKMAGAAVRLPGNFLATESIGNPELAQTGRDIEQLGAKMYQDSVKDEQRNQPTFDSKTASGLYGGARSLEQMLATLLATGPAGALPALAAQSGLQATGEALDKGKDYFTAGAYGVGQAGLEYVTEKMPMGYIANKLGKTGFKVFVAGFLLRELPSEQIATITQDALQKAVLEPEKTWTKYLQERPDAAYQTLLATGVMTGGMGALNQGSKYLNDKNNEKLANDAKNAALAKWANSGLSQPDTNGKAPLQTPAPVPPVEPTAPTVSPTEDAAAAPAPTAEPTTDTYTDQEVTDFAGNRYQQLRDKRDGKVDQETGEVIPGQGLSPTDQKEMASLQQAKGNPAELRTLYGFNDVQDQPAPAGPEAPTAQAPGETPKAVAGDAATVAGVSTAGSGTVEGGGVDNPVTQAEQEPAATENVAITKPDPLLLTPEELAAPAETAQQQLQPDDAFWNGDEALVPEPVAPATAPKTEKERNQQADYSAKWFGSQEKAEAFVDSKRIGDTHQVVKNGQKFEIKLKDKTDVTQAPQAEQAAQEGPKAPAAKVRPSGAMSAWNTPKAAYIEATGESESVHRGSVERALKAGKAVPAEVIADYPDLAQTDKPEAQWTRTREVERRALSSKAGFTGNVADRHARTPWANLPENVQERLTKAMDPAAEPVAPNTEKEAKASKAEVMRELAKINEQMPEGFQASDGPLGVGLFKDGKPVESLQGLSRINGYSELLRHANRMAKPEPSSAPTVEKNSTDDLNSMFDEVLAEEVAKDQPKTESGETPDFLLRQKSQNERPLDGVQLGTGKFVTMENSVAFAKKHMDPADWSKPFQFNRVLDIAPVDWDRMVAAMSTQTAKPKTEKAAKAKRTEQAKPDRGTVGMKLASGQVVLTQTGRATTPFPNVNTETARKTGNTVKAVNRWLIANALAEAQERGDTFNERQFQAVNNLNASQSDKDSAEEYLFGDYIPKVVTSILKPLTSAAKNTGSGLANAIDGLGALFGGSPGKLNSGLTFDEDTYAKAKPLFQAAIADLGNAKNDLKEAMRTVIRMVLDKFGAQAARNMKPYVVRFIEETGDQAQNQAKEKDDASTVQTESVPERDSGKAQDDAATVNRDPESVGPGVAEGGQGTDRSGATATGTDRAGEAGTGSPEQSGEQPSGAPRDRTGVRPDAGPTDFVIDADEIGKGGLAKKYRDNVAAIKILKTLESENRVATPEERKTLSKYVGWGAMKGPFDPENKQWAKQHAEIKELLTEAEFRAARRSTLDAHYTSPVAIGAMNDALERMGYQGGRMLEPSVGVGNFYGLMPAAVRNASQLFGVELDSLTSRMVAALYPKAKIAQAKGFEDFQIPAEYFDLVQGNPPFGNQPLTDSERSPYSGFSIHNYFLAKGIDKLRPGGIMQVVVSHNFLDANDGRARKWIGERASLIGAVRLPNTAFKENAGTDVVTDILIFQKKTDTEYRNALGNEAKWQNVVDQTNTNPKTGEAVKHKVNEFFVSNPQHVLGTPTAAGSMYAANEYTVQATGDIKPMLAEWVKTLPQNIYNPIDRRADSAVVDMAIPDGVKTGSFYLDATGKVMQRGEDVMGNKTANDWTPGSERAIARMKGMIALRDLLRGQMRLERSADATEAEIEANRVSMNSVYDAFLKAHGHLNSQVNRKIFLDDTESQLLQALEFDYDKGISAAVAASEGIEERPAGAVKADIFKRRVAFPPQDFLTVSTAKDALLSSLNYRGKVDVAYMAEVYNKSPDEIIKELGDVVFDDPQAGVVTADEYLSGDVKTKLVEAKSAAQADAKYKRNVTALEKVIPADKKPSEISVSLGAAFVPAELYQQFVKHISGGNATANYLQATGQWLISFQAGTDQTLNTGKFGTSSLNAQELFQLSMLGRGAVVKQTYKNPDGSTTTVVLEKETEAAREKQNAIKAEWKTWLWGDADRADKVASIYNDKMNRIVERKFDGSHLTHPGMSPAISLLAHQKNGVWRGLQSYQVLYDHVVGAGKTFEMATLAMEMRRLGIARKPLFVVPNHLTLQWRSEFTRLYPGSNILAATPEDFGKATRERLFSKIITGDWDAVVIGHSSLKKIGLPVETEKAVLQEQIDEIAQAIEEMKRGRGDKNIIRDMEKIRSNLETKMKDKLAAIGARSKVVTFDELGIDAMFIDEMHEFKNLTYNSTMDRNPGMGNPAGSSKAFDMFVKTRWMFDTFGAKTPYITATGTPVSNSLVEMYNMQRYMQYPTLKKEGLHVFDAWAKQFGSVDNVYEVAPSGSGYRQSTRFAKFTNLPALMGLYNTFADTVTLDDLKAQEEAQGKKFPVPKLVGGGPVNVVAKRSPQVAERMGVPKAELDKAGNVLFGINISEYIAPTITKDEKTGKWLAQATITWEDGGTGTTEFGAFDIEQDARLKIVQTALSPVITVDPNSILGRFANLKKLMKDSKGKVNALSLTGEANKMGLDYRLIDPTAKDFQGSKINLAVGNMMRVYKQWAADKGTQLVFCDMSIPLSARASFGSKARRLYVRDDSGAIEMKRGTMHTVAGHEYLPFFVVQRGEKDAKRFDTFDAATGMKLQSDFRTKADAIEAVSGFVVDDKKRQKWIDAAAARSEITADQVDEYNNDNDVETEGFEAFTPEDIAGMSGSAKFSVYDDIKAKLIAQGVPEREIAFIHDYSTPVAKAKLFKAVNTGDIRFLLGSTPKMGAGTNVQERAVGLHHIDAPWRPSDLEQREGRIIRRGNKLYERDPEGFEVFIGRYATEQTYDTRRWQILEHKARGIEQLRNFDGSLNEIDDIEGEAANSADMKAAASGDPLILEETKLRNEVRRMEQLEAGHADEVVSMGRKAKDAQAYADKAGPAKVKEISELVATAAKHKLDKDGWSPVTVDGKVFADKDAALAELARVSSLVRAGMQPEAVVMYRGMEFTASNNGNWMSVDSPTGNLANYGPNEPFSTSGFLQRLKNYVDRLPAALDDTKANIEKAIKDADNLRAQAAKPFAQTKELADARERHKAVQRALMAKGPAVPESQKALVEKGIADQKSKLEKLGFGDAIGEFFGSGNATLNEPTDSYNVDPYENSDTRPGTNQQQLATGRDALAGLARRFKVDNSTTGGIHQDGTRGSILGNRMYANFVAGKPNQLVGQLAFSPRDMASLAQVYRDPRFETFRVVYMQGNIIVGEAGYTSRLPALVKVPDNLDELMRKDMTRFGADGYYIMHNHPSGESNPSSADINLTKDIAKSTIGMRGHIIIDHNEYATITPRGTVTVIKDDTLNGTDFKSNPILEHKLLGVEINSPKKVADLAKALQIPAGHATLVLSDRQSMVQLLVDVPMAALMDTSRQGILKGKALIRRMARDTGSGGIRTIVLPDGVATSALKQWVTEGVFNDVVSADGDSVRFNGVGHPGDFLDKGYKSLVVRENEGGYDTPGVTRRIQNNIIQFWGNRDKTPSLKTFGTYDKTLSTQYNKALKDKHFGKVFGLVNAMQNEVSLTSIRPSELAPGVLPRVDDVKSAAKQVIRGKKANKSLTDAANAVFAGTLNGANVMQGTVWSEADLRSRFNLDDTGVALYQQSRAAIDASLDEVASAEAYAMAQGYIPKAMRRSIIDNPSGAESLIVGEITNQIRMLDTAIRAATRQGNDTQAEELKASRAEYVGTKRKVEKIFLIAKNLKLAGYAPLMRFGGFTVTAQSIDPMTGNVNRDENGESLTLFYGQFETEGEAKAVRRDLEAQYAGRDDVHVKAGSKSHTSHELYAGISPETLALFAEVVGATEATKALYQNALSERSALKRRLERKGTAGFSEDMPRVLSNFITSNGRFAAQRYYLRDLNNAIKFIPKEKGDVLDEAMALKKFIMDPQDSGAVASSAMFAWFLGGSVASAMVNLTQPVMMTAPYLSQFGVKLATKELAKAIPQAMGKKQITDAGLRAALKRAGQEGIVDAQEIFHLYAVGAQSVASGLVNTLAKLPMVGDKVKAGSESSRARITAFGTLWGSMFSLAEGFNRRLTFIAAWNMALANTEQNPYAFAVRAVNETQGIYNKVNRPNWARSTVGRTVLTFKQFSLMYLEMLSRMWNRGGPEGKRAAMIMMAVLMLASGEEGLPFAQDLDDLIDTIGQLFGLDTNMKRFKRRHAHEIMGKQLGDLFLYGVSASLPLDFSGRLGLGNLIPGTSLLKPASESGRTREVAEVAGPAAGLITQVMDAYDAAAEGNYGKAAQNLAPTAVKNALAGVSSANKGYATDTKGRKVVETTGGDAFLKGIGFNPNVVAQETRRTTPAFQDIALQKQTEASIVGMWAQGVADKDQAMMDKAMKRMTDWNKANPDTQIQISAQQIRNRARQLVTDKETRLMKLAPREMRGRMGLDSVQ